MAYPVLTVTDNAVAQLNGAVSSVGLPNIQLKSGQGEMFPQIIRGAISSVSGFQFDVPDASNLEVGQYVYNENDESNAVIREINGNTLKTTNLTGGSINAWADGDIFVVGAFIATLERKNATGDVEKFEKILVTERDEDILSISGRGIGGNNFEWLPDDFLSILINKQSYENLLKVSSEAIVGVYDLRSQDVSIDGIKAFKEKTVFEKSMSVPVATDSNEPVPLGQLVTLTNSSTFIETSISTEGKDLSYEFQEAGAYYGQMAIVWTGTEYWSRGNTTNTTANQVRRLSPGFTVGAAVGGADMNSLFSFCATWDGTHVVGMYSGYLFRKYNTSGNQIGSDINLRTLVPGGSWRGIAFDEESNQWYLKRYNEGKIDVFNSDFTQLIETKLFSALLHRNSLVIIGQKLFVADKCFNKNTMMPMVEADLSISSQRNFTKRDGLLVAAQSNTIRHFDPEKNRGSKITDDLETGLFGNIPAGSIILVSGSTTTSGFNSPEGMMKVTKSSANTLWVDNVVANVAGKSRIIKKL